MRTGFFCLFFVFSSVQSIKHKCQMSDTVETDAGKAPRILQSTVLDYFLSLAGSLNMSNSPSRLSTLWFIVVLNEKRTVHVANGKSSSCSQSVAHVALFMLTDD